MEHSTKPLLEPGEYEHYKGGRYEVLGVGRHTESGEDIVVYRPLYEAEEEQPDFWLRPYEMFIGWVELDGVKVPRFRKIN